MTGTSGKSRKSQGQVYWFVINKDLLISLNQRTCPCDCARYELYFEFITKKKASELEDYELSQEDIKLYLNDDSKEKTLKMYLDDIINETLNYLDLSKEILKSKKRNKKISIARRVIILLAKKYTRESSVSINKEICVTKSLVSKVDRNLLKTDEELYNIYSQMEKRIHSTFQPRPLSCLSVTIK